MRMRRSTALALALLVISTTQMVTLAQQVTLNAAHSAGTAAINEATAYNGGLAIDELTKVLSNAALASRGATSNAKLGPVLNIPASVEGSPALSLNLTAVPGLARLLSDITLREANVPGSSNMTQAIMQGLAQAQQAGNISVLENSANALRAFSEENLDFGTGGNLQIFLTRVAQVRTLRDSLTTFLGVAQVETFTGWVLDGISALFIPQAALVVALLALLTSITAEVGAALGIAGASLNVASDIIGLVQTVGPAPSDPAVERSATSNRFAALRSQSTNMQRRFFSFAFSDRPAQFFKLMETALGGLNAILTPQNASSINSSMRSDIMSSLETLPDDVMTFLRQPRTSFRQELDPDIDGLSEEDADVIASVLGLLGDILGLASAVVATAAGGIGILTADLTTRLAILSAVIAPESYALSIASSYPDVEKSFYTRWSGALTQVADTLAQIHDGSLRTALAEYRSDLLDIGGLLSATTETARAQAQSLRRSSSK